MLKDLYHKLEGKGFEVVFVSSDKDQQAFNEYFGQMPWLALPFADRDRKNLVSQRFSVSGIPTLILLKGDGSVLSTNGRGVVQSDTEGSQFPWTELAQNSQEGGCQVQ